jgi:MYXO-CTERM domain-containing protein
LAAGTVLGSAACSSTDASNGGAQSSEVAGHEDDDGHEEVGTTSAALTATDPVSSAVLQSCTTTSVKGLATQLVEEIQCMKPGTMTKIDNIPNVTLGSAVFPYLQTPARNALAGAVAARGVPMSINSALRALPQQYLLYRWSQTGRCGIGLAAKPGTSNHEGAVAVDINDNAGWRTAMQGKGFRWLGASDPVHYDYVAGGINLRGVSVQAFQRLWNRNHPEDLIAEDGSYGPTTEARLAKSPVGGFAKGACKAMMDGGTPTGPDSGTGVPEPTIPDTPETPQDVPEVPDATEPAATGEPDQELPTQASEGCSMHASSSTQTGSGLALLALGLVIVAKRRRRD